MTRRSTLALPAAGFVWASVCPRARDSSTETTTNRADFQLRTYTMLFPSVSLHHATPWTLNQACPGITSVYESIPWALTVREARALCVSSPNNVKYEFSCMLTQESYKLPAYRRILYLGPTLWFTTLDISDLSWWERVCILR